MSHGLLNTESICLGVKQLYELLRCFLLLFTLHWRRPSLSPGGPLCIVRSKYVCGRICHGEDKYNNAWKNFVLIEFVGGRFIIFHFSIVKSTLLFINWISLYFFHVLLNNSILCNLLLFFDEVVIGRRVFFVSFPLYCFHTHTSLFTFCFSFLFNSCCFHAWVFGRTLLHEL